MSKYSLGLSSEKNNHTRYLSWIFLWRRGIRGIIEFRPINHLFHDRTSQYPSLSHRDRYSILPYTMSHTRWIPDCHRRRCRTRYSQCYHRAYTPGSHSSTQCPHSRTIFPHHQCPHGLARSEDRTWIRNQRILDRARIRRRPRSREYGTLSSDEDANSQIRSFYTKTTLSLCGFLYA